MWILRDKTVALYLASLQVGLAIRNYFNHQARTFVESLLDQPLSDKTRASITSAHRGTLRDFLNTLCLLADRCRSHGPRDE